MKSRCLLNSCNSTSQFISITFRCSIFFPFLYQIKNLLFLLRVSLYMITGIYLHDPPLSTTHFWVSKSCDPPSVSNPLPPANFSGWARVFGYTVYCSLITGIRYITFFEFQVWSIPGYKFGYFWVFWRIFFGYTGIPLPPLADPDFWQTP